MIKFAKIAMAASVFMMPLAANASLDGTYTGNVDVEKGISLNCQLTAVVAGGGTQVADLYITKKNIFDILCPTISFSGFPYSVDDLGGSTYRINDVFVNTITSGDCTGNINVTHVASPTEKISINGTLPADTGGGDCYVSGDLIKQ